jgi:hypothetical protein
LESDVWFTESKNCLAPHLGQVNFLCLGVLIYKMGILLPSVSQNHCHRMTSHKGRWKEHGAGESEPWFCWITHSVNY